MATFSVDYFKVHVPDGPPFVEAFHQCELYEEYSEDLRLFGDVNYLRLEELDQDGYYWEGDLVRVHMDKTAMRAPMEAPLRPVRLEDDEGIGETTAFLYDEQLGVLALEKNRRGATPTKFVKYFRRHLDPPASMELLPIFSRNAMGKFDRMQRHTKFHIKVAGGQRGDIATENESLQRIFEIADALDSPHLDLVLSVGQMWRSEELNGRNLTQLVYDLFKDIIGGDEGTAEIEKVVINGRTPEEKTEVVDLIEQRIKDSMNLDPDEHRALSYELRSMAMRSLYRERREELVEMYGGQ